MFTHQRFERSGAHDFEFEPLPYSPPRGEEHIQSFLRREPAHKQRAAVAAQANTAI